MNSSADSSGVAPNHSPLLPPAVASHHRAESGRSRALDHPSEPFVSRRATDASASITDTPAVFDDLEPAVPALPEPGDLTPDENLVEFADEQAVIHDEPGDDADYDLPWLITQDDHREEASFENGFEVGPAETASAASEFAAPAHADARVMEEIADRLERIARSLRARDGQELAGDATDPLEVLITGYALGYSDGRRQSSRDPRGNGEE